MNKNNLVLILIIIGLVFVINKKESFYQDITSISFKDNGMMKFSNPYFVNGSNGKWKNAFRRYKAPTIKKDRDFETCEDIRCGGEGCNRYIWNKPCYVKKDKNCPVKAGEGYYYEDKSYKCGDIKKCLPSCTKFNMCSK